MWAHTWTTREIFLDSQQNSLSFCSSKPPKAFFLLFRLQHTRIFCRHHHYLLWLNFSTCVSQISRIFCHFSTSALYCSEWVSERKKLHRKIFSMKKWSNFLISKSRGLHKASTRTSYLFFGWTQSEIMKLLAYACGWLKHD